MLIAGANNAGKTALLSAVDVVARISGDATSLRHLGSQDPAEVTATFRLSDGERESLWPQTSRRDALVANGVADRVQFVLSEQGGQMKVGLVLAEWPGAGFQPFAALGPHALSAGALQVEVARALVGGEDGREDRVLVGLTEGPFGGEVLLEDYWRTPALLPLVGMLDMWRSRYFHFRALRQGTERIQQLHSPEKLDPSGSNLAGVLHFLLTDRHEAFEEVRVVIAEIVPGIGELHVRTGGDQLRVVFETDAGEINLKDLGTGVEQLLMTLVVGLTEAAPYTLVVEEPETNLHPAAQRALLGFFQEWAADRQIIAATHSPVMLDWSPGGDRLWLVERDGGESSVRPVEEDPLSILRSLGVRPSDVLIADRLLVVEGPSDQDILEAWFPQLLRRPAVAILAGEGGDSAVHADRLAAWITGADRTGIQQVLYMRDRDELAPEMLARLTAASSVYVLSKRELENYLIDPQAIAAVLGALSPPADPVPSPDEVAAAVAETAELLRRRIIINRVCRRIQPSAPYMTHRLRQELATAGTDQEQIFSAVSGRLMTADDLRSQVKAAWTEAEAEVDASTGDDLLSIAPGEDILDAVFMRFAGRHYNKRVDGQLLAKAIEPPAELRDLLDRFLAD